ncbi:MAG: hypothetical protein KME32_00670 [Mojavia pulchra JT2-VF2]|jgi:hypothetical protein|uniref:Uncharacterized protein n=1 Tax=Mojavia pulchra JT2-VF2 TaxID=287848 RepID=A0A951PVA1_9NOST|nr:hypothetical protein [Mojavia pulchra JT2-VF2]
MQPNSWKNLLFAVLLTTSGTTWCCISVDKGWAENSDVEMSIKRRLGNNLASKSTFLANAQITHQFYQKYQGNPSNYESLLRSSELAKTEKNQQCAKLNQRNSPAKQIDIHRFSNWESCFDTYPSSNHPLQLSFSETVFKASRATIYCKDNWCKNSIGLRILYSQTPPDDVTQPQPPTAEPNPAITENPDKIQQQNNPPQLEVQPNNFPKPSPEAIERLLERPQIDYSQRLEMLRQLLQKKTQIQPESQSNLELGLRIRQRTLPPSLEQPSPPLIEEPVAQFKPIGYLQARVAYFHTSNIFSSDVDPIEDSLMFYGLTLASAYLPLGPKTYINGSIDGNLIRYVDQSIYNYNQIRFNLGLYQQLSRRMYGEISWSNQLLFYANNGDFFKAGDRFLNENSLRLSLGRRDPLSSKFFLDSFYELSFNFADPKNRNRIINSLWLSLSYYWQKSLQVGLNYQLNLTNFTQRQDLREDEFHRLFGHLTYRTSNYSSFNLQSGFNFGSSNAANIDFDGWFFSVNYNWDLGQF